MRKGEPFKLVRVRTENMSLKYEKNKTNFWNVDLREKWQVHYFQKIRDCATGALSYARFGL